MADDRIAAIPGAAATGGASMDNTNIDTDRPWAALYNEDARALDTIRRAPDVSIETVIAEAVAKFGPQRFVTTALPTGASASLTFAEVDERAASFAVYLRETLGLKAGDVVAIQAPNCVGYVVAMIGIIRAGLILSNINPLYTSAETRGQLEDSGAKALVFIDLFGDRIDEAVRGLSEIHLIKTTLTDFFPPLRATLLSLAMKYVSRLIPAMTSPHTTLREAVRAHTPPPRPLSYAAERETDATGFYQYSGGTTGRSKGVELTFTGLMHNIEQVGSLSRILQRENRTALLVLPLYHMFGFYFLMSTLTRGGHLALAPSPRPLRNLKRAFETFRPDTFPGVNALFAGLLQQDWFRENPPQLELTVTGATALNPAVGEEWSRLTGSLIMESYGMTESTTVLTTNPPDERLREGSVGLPIPGTDIRVLREDGERADIGEHGEIVARGPQIMKGYFNAPEESANAFTDGWLRTGDVGFLDADGYLHLVDRKKDMIDVNGFNVFPNEVENALMAHPGAAEAGVVGAKTKDGGGEQVVAFVVKADPALTKDDLFTHCAARLTNYKRPKIIRFVDELPKSPVGKVLRRELRELL